MAGTQEPRHGRPPALTGDESGWWRGPGLGDDLHTAFNWPEPDHLRIVFLPVKDEINKAIGKLGEFLATYTPLEI